MIFSCNEIFSANLHTPFCLLEKDSGSPLREAFLDLFTKQTGGVLIYMCTVKMLLPKMFV